MKTSGIRINDEKNGVVSAELKDYSAGNSYYWSILFLEATGDLGEDRSMPLFEEEIKNNENGLILSWEELKSLANKFYQIIEITIIGCKDRSLLQRYKNYEEIYERCDFIIEMIDSSFWEIRSKDRSLIERLENRYE